MARLSAFVLSALNAQANHEFQNQQAYLSLASWANFSGLTGCAKWLAGQARDEGKHAALVIEYIEDRNEMYVPAPITSPLPLPGSVVEAFQKVYEVETGTTQTIQDLYRLAFDSNDQMTCAFLAKGLILEQIEEENKAQTCLDRLAACGADGAALAAFDVWIGSL